ncbi:MAG TPA: DUF4838 domain-containing protein [Candidatus Lokiarchaeia archaeon]|nr:DUF4838 domain-containing protein [Candidatus Lokiarchaeia archaeon]
MNLHLLPLPKEITYPSGIFSVTPSAPLYHNKFRLKPLLLPLFQFFQNYLKINVPLDPIRDGLLDERLSKEIFFLFWTTEANLSLVNQEMNPDESIPAQGYLLQVTPDFVKLQATDERGFFNGIQTLRQVLEQVFLGLVRQGGTIESFDIPCLQIRDVPSMEIRGFHVDLKLIMHRYDYLKEFINLLPQYKINAILLEYEDKFPYTGDLQVVRHKYCLTDAQVNEIDKMCLRNHVEVIPLVQAFGHLPFLLKHDEFAHIRETPDKDWSVCPLNPETFEVISNMIRQVCTKHLKTHYFHIGSDEVYNLGTCPNCNKYVEEHGRSQLYVEYINKIAQIVKEQGKIPIMWSDYLIKYPDALDQLDHDIIVMYWDYGASGSEVDYLWTDGFARGEEILRRNSPAFLQEIEKYITTPAFPATVKGLPFIKFFQDRGFKVLGAPSTNSDFYWTIPNYPRRLPNLTCHATRIAEAGALGVVMTSWADCGAPLETQWHAILWGADQCWNPRGIDAEMRANFDARFNATYFGCPEPAPRNVTELLFEVVEKPEKIPSASAIEVQATSLPNLFEGLQDLHQIATRDRETLDFLEFGLKGHQLIFDITATTSRIEDAFIQVEETGADLPDGKAIASMREDLHSLLTRVEEYYEESAHIHEDRENGILYAGEFRQTYDKFFPKLTDYTHNLLENLGDPAANLDDILLNAYRRRIG